MELKTQTQNDKILNSNLKFLVGAGVGAGVVGAVLMPQSVQAITVADVNTQLAAVVTNTDAAADAAFPVGASILALMCIGYALKRFIMAN